jgi:DNA-binding CsgD family transcriptional regulator
MTEPPRSLNALGDTADGLYVVDHHDQRIVRWNAGAERLLGYRAAEVLRRPCYEVIGGCHLSGRPICGPNCAVHRAVRRGELPRSLEGYARTKSGRLVALHFGLLVISSRPAPLVVHTLHEVGDGGRRIGTRDGGAGRDGSALTPREREVLRLVADGLSNAGIAARLGISRFTARNHVQRILAKSGTHSRAEVVSFAYRSGRL